MKEVKQTGFEEKWRGLVEHLIVFEERWVIGWYLTGMEVMSDVVEESMDILVTCVGLVKWIVGWNWYVKETRPPDFENIM